LNLSNNQLTQVPIVSLTFLGELDLSNNMISDTTFLANQTYLKSLNLSGNQISDINPLVNVMGPWAGFGTVNLAHNQIRDLSPLSTMDKLWSLNVSYNQLESLLPRFFIQPARGFLARSVGQFARLRYPQSP